MSIMLKIFKRILFVKALFFAAYLIFLPPQNSCANFAKSPCDPQYYESLEARAWLEAQREISQNQNLITKPDSVLEYTCFAKHLDVLTQQAPNMFSETTRWGSTPGDMENSLDNLVGASIREYAENFNHNLLGGRSDTEHSLDEVDVSAGTYECEVMQAIWMEAKCMNFIDEPLSDGFFTFEEYSSRLDVRRHPRRCSDIRDEYEDNIELAYGDNTPWTEDNIVTYYSDIFPVSACGTGNISRIPTGYIVYEPKNTASSTPTEFPEHVCIKPGCYFDGNSACVRAP